MMISLNKLARLLYHVVSNLQKYLSLFGISIERNATIFTIRLNRINRVVARYLRDILETIQPVPRGSPASMLMVASTPG